MYAYLYSYLRTSETFETYYYLAVLYVYKQVIWYSFLLHNKYNATHFLQLYFIVALPFLLLPSCLLSASQTNTYTRLMLDLLVYVQVHFILTSSLLRQKIFLGLIGFLIFTYFFPLCATPVSQVCYYIE